MSANFYLYNTLSRTKEKFEAVHDGMLGLYVCGPTVYSDPHLGHARPGVTYDVLVRLFLHLGNKVRYVRNITDVGHLENDADEGEDKISKRAKLLSLEPMEIVQQYTIIYHDAMRMLNTLPPSIEPSASGHIIEQIALVEKIIAKGFAYESNGSVYFDINKYCQEHNYGALSGRNIDEMLSNTRTLDGQQDKRNPYDFALWKKASPEHIMRWPSPWSDGFPGWHLECSVMSEKYLGEFFDIHGGGMDLQFPHHECELAQNTVRSGQGGAKYWMHNNMITINGKKMGKSLGNFITMMELFNGEHELLEQAYSPMTIRFFILQAHYRSTLDFSNEALKASEKGYLRMIQAAKDLSKLTASDKASDKEEITSLKDKVITAICDDLNTPIALSHLFEAVKFINQAKDKQITLSTKDKEVLDYLMLDFIPNVLGLCDESNASGAENIIGGLMDMIIDIRKVAKSNKDFATSDLIRDKLSEIGIQIKDTKDGAEWTF